jgi:hypothetical protein
MLETPPVLVERDAAPPVRLDRDLGGVTLVGYAPPAVADGYVTLKTWWRVANDARVVVVSRAGGTMLESHELGFGNLARYRAERGLQDAGIVVEELSIVLPSSVPPGAHALDVGVVDFQAGIGLQWAALGEVRVP